MAQNKTQQTQASVDEFIDGVENDTRRSDARALLEMMERVTGEAPKMWGASIIGFGRYHYRYDSGREDDWMRVGFSPRKSNTSLYMMSKPANYDALLERLGKHKTGASCLYVNRLADVDMDVLEQMVAGAWEASIAQYADA